MKYLLVIVFLSIGTFSFSQQDSWPHKMTSREFLFKVDKKFIVIDSFITTPQTLILHDSSVVVRTVYRANDSVVIHMQLKNKDLELVRLPGILKKFKVSSEFVNLRICINKIIIKDTDKILADLTQIKEISIINDPYTPEPTLVDSGEKFLNIVLL
jgi:hypothetical protein